MVNEAPYKLKLYLSNTLLKSDSNCEVARADVEALSDLQTLDLYCYSYLPMPTKQGDNNKGEGGIETERIYFREEFDIVLAPYDMSSEYSNFRTFYKTYHSYRNKYLYEETQYFDYAIHNANKVIAVTTLEFEPDPNSDLIELRIKLAKRK